MFKRSMFNTQTGSCGGQLEVVANVVHHPACVDLMYSDLLVLNRAFDCYNDPHRP